VLKHEFKTRTFKIKYILLTTKLHFHLWLYSVFNIVILIISILLIKRGVDGDDVPAQREFGPLDLDRLTGVKRLDLKFLFVSALASFHARSAECATLSSLRLPRIHRCLHPLASASSLS
jgi:hypothetical protein